MIATDATAMHEEAMPLAIHTGGKLQIPVLAEQHFRAGVEQLGIGEPQQALVSFQQALTYSPDFADAHVGTGIAHALCYDIYPAIDHLHQATELDPTSFHAHYKLSQLYFKLRVPDKGYAEAKLALSCATDISERQLLAHLLREERAREHNGVSRPTWNQGSRKSIVLACLATAMLLLAALVHLLS